MRGAGRMGIAARLRERLLRGRGGFLRAKDLQGEASGAAGNGIREETRSLTETAGGAEEIRGALREANGVVRKKTRKLTETAGGAEETGGALKGAAKGNTPVLGETFAGAGGETPKALRESGAEASGGREYDEAGARAYSLEHGEAPERLTAELRQGAEASGGREYDEAGVRAYLLEHGEVLERLTAELRQGAEGGDAPALLGRGARVVTRTPSDRPRTIADAGEMAEQYFRRTHI